MENMPREQDETGHRIALIERKGVVGRIEDKSGRMSGNPEVRRWN